MNQGSAIPNFSSLSITRSEQSRKTVRGGGTNLGRGKLNFENRSGSFGDRRRALNSPPPPVSRVMEYTPVRRGLKRRRCRGKGCPSDLPSRSASDADRDSHKNKRAAFNERKMMISNFNPRP